MSKHPTSPRDTAGQDGDAISSLVSILDAIDTLPDAAWLRARSYELLGPVRGRPVVDVGCGTGRAAAEMTDRGAAAVGVDLNEEMIAIARRRWPATGFRVGDACALPLPDGWAAGYRAEKVYHDLEDPLRALAEARRVLAPGGRIVLVGQDWDTLVIDSDDPALTRTIVHTRADTVRAPRAARGYRNLLLEAGFEGVTVEVHTGVFTDQLVLPVLSGAADAAHTAGIVTAEQAEAWAAEQAERGRSGRLFVAVPMFVAAARRP